MASMVPSMAKLRSSTQMLLQQQHTNNSKLSGTDNNSFDVTSEHRAWLLLHS